MSDTQISVLPAETETWQQKQELKPLVSDAWLRVTLAKRIMRPGSDKVVHLAATTAVPLPNDDSQSISDVGLSLSDGTTVALSLSCLNDGFISAENTLPYRRYMYDPHRYERTYRHRSPWLFFFLSGLAIFASNHYWTDLTSMLQQLQQAARKHDPNSAAPATHTSPIQPITHRTNIAGARKTTAKIPLTTPPKTTATTNSLTIPAPSHSLIQRSLKPATAAQAKAQLGRNNATHRRTAGDAQMSSHVPQYPSLPSTPRTGSQKRQSFFIPPPPAYAMPIWQASDLPPMPSAMAAATQKSSTQKQVASNSPALSALQKLAPAQAHSQRPFTPATTTQTNHRINSNGIAEAGSDLLERAASVEFSNWSADATPKGKAALTSGSNAQLPLRLNPIPLPGE